jgi:predicted methyltransferase
MPAEILAFAQIDPGEKVGDFIMGGGYWTRILSNAVGPQGKVYAFQPDEFIAFRPAYGDEQNAAVAGRPTSSRCAARSPHRRSPRSSTRSSPCRTCTTSTSARCRRAPRQGARCAVQGA